MIASMLFAALAEREDDAAVARDLAARDEEFAAGVVLLQERHVGTHVRVDFLQVRLIDELDDEHARWGSCGLLDEPPGGVVGS